MEYFDWTGSYYLVGNHGNLRTGIHLYRVEYFVRRNQTARSRSTMVCDGQQTQVEGGYPNVDDA